MLLPRFKMLRLNRHLLEFKEQLAHSRADAAGTPSFRDFLGNIGSAGSSTVPDSAANHPYIHETHQAGKDRRGNVTDVILTHTEPILTSTIISLRL